MPEHRVTVEPFFLPASDGGQRFCLLRAPDTSPIGAVLFVHAWCEEMNKARRMVTLQAQQLAESGFAVLQLDLAGCGDSSGDFSEASWIGWVGDVKHGAQWLSSRFRSPLWIWGLRSGCLLASAAVDELEQEAGLLFWQPVTSGATHLQQFLRLKLAGQALDGKSGAKVDDFKQALRAGESVEVAGYELSPALALGLERARLTPTARPTHVVWIEVVPDSETSISAASEAALARWQEAGHSVSASVVSGPGFWRTTEIEDAPALLAATTSAVQSLRAASK